MSPPRPRPPRTPPPAAPGATHWGPVAPWYDQLVGDEGSDYQKHVVFPGAVKLLQLAAGRRVLDVACGQGALCRVLRGAGAQATGVDAARPLIERARRRDREATDAGPPITYHVADARRLDAVPALREAPFDAAVCVLAIQNIDPIGPVFAGVAPLLRLDPPGRFVLVMMHPCFRGPKATSWGWDEQKKVQYRRVDRYLLPRREPIVTHPGKDPGRYTWTFHRPLQHYVKALSAAGLLIDAIEEWPGHKQSTSGPRAAAENRARSELPMFLALRARRAHAPASPTPSAI